jgi:hypothetical protein
MLHKWDKAILSGNKTLDQVKSFGLLGSNVAGETGYE